MNAVIATLPQPLVRAAALLGLFGARSSNGKPSLLALLARGGIGAVVASIVLLALDVARRRRSDVISDAVFGRAIWGHALMLLMTQDKRHDMAFEVARGHLDRGEGFTSAFWAPGLPTFLMTNSPTNLEHILKANFDNYIKGPRFYVRQMALLGHGIFNGDGASWKAQRKTAAHIFSVKNFRDFMLQVFDAHTHHLVDILGEAAKKGETVDLYDLFHRFTLDAFMEIGFGTSLGSLQAKDPLPFATAFDTAQAITARRFVMNDWQQWITEFFNGDARLLKRCTRTTDEFADRVIRTRRAQLAAADAHDGKDAGLAPSADLLSRFLKMKKPDSDAGYSDKELRDVVINFIIAGRDTTAQALSWTIYLLWQHPAVTATLRAEIDRVLPNHLAAPKGASTEADYVALTKDLVYARSVFSEALRLYPSVPTEIKYAVDYDVWPDGTKVRPGEGIIWSPYAMGRLTEIWGPDATAFRPERWIDNNGNFIQPSPFKYPVFNAGPRTCLGQQMAYLEGVSCLVSLVRRFDFDVVNADDVTYRTALTLQMKNGLKVVPKLRV
ncbi:hypothetical protein H9P43_009884 [Blastocladiella emersonii ATCC 22665]|nr:hypothetical protein H9P43_009884 [Blastocladiella emersonii ATCC 22665]